MVWLKDFRGNLINSDFIAKITSNGTSITAHIVNHPPDPIDQPYDEIELFIGGDKGDADSAMDYYAKMLKAIGD